MAALEKLILYDEVLFAPGALVSRWADSIMVTFTEHARREAPVNSRPNKGRGALPVGSLRGSITGSVNHIGAKVLNTEVSVNVPYALYVLKGTGPRIFSRSARVPKGEQGGGQFIPVGPGQGMYLPSNPGYGKSMFVQSVRGQPADNFLARAGEATAALHPSLRGFGTV